MGTRQRYGGEVEAERVRAASRPTGARRPAGAPTVVRLLELQRTAGNRAVVKLLRQATATDAHAPPSLDTLADKVADRARPAIERQRTLEWGRRAAGIVRRVANNPRQIKDDPELRTALSSLSRAQRRELTELALAKAREWVQSEQLALVAEAEAAVHDALADRFTELSEAAASGPHASLFALSFKYLIRNGVMRQLTSPTTKPRRGKEVKWSGVCGVGKAEAVFPALHDKDLVATLRRLPKKQRLALEQSITVAAFGWSATAVKAAGANPSTLKDEWDALASPAQKNIEGGMAGYFSCRAGLLNAFGSPSDPMASLAKANSYYTSLQPAEFLAGSAGGTSTLVHPDMKAALDAAEKLMVGRGWRVGVGASVDRYWSTSIRENRNSPRRLSDHSFGWAIDINASDNPNITSKKDKAFIQEMLGSDVFTVRGTKKKSALANRVISGTDTDDIHAAATEIRAASGSFRRLMANPLKLRVRLAVILHERGVKTNLPTMVRLIDAAGKAAAKLASDDKSIKKSGAAGREAFRGELVTIVQSANPALSAKKVNAVAAAATEVVMRALDVERRIADPSSVGRGSSLHQLAVHGFANLDPRLVAALVSPEGGNLKWLGVHNQDMHHFELKTEPTLPKADIAAKASPAELPAG